MSCRLVLALLDDFYDPETAMKLTYGCEGDTYTYDTYGKLEFSDKLLNHPVGYTFWRQQSFIFFHQILWP